MVVAFFSWWYGAGWRLQSERVIARLASLSDFFSISLLLQTLFAPFRQISVGSVQGPLGMQLRAVVDKLISRCIGGLIRSVMIIVAIVLLLIYSVWAVLRIGIWPLLPLLPVFGAAASAIGWIPWN